MGSNPDEARITAYRCLFEVLENQGYSNLVLKQELSGSFLDEKNRAFVTAMVYGTVTRVYTIDAMLAPYLKKKLCDIDAPVRTCLRMGAWQVLFAYGVKDYAAVSSTVDLTREVCGKGTERLVNAVLRRLAEEGKSQLEAIPLKRADVRYSLKSEIAGCFIKWYGREKAEKIMDAYLTVPKVTLRPNRIRVPEIETLIEKLGEDGLHATVDPILPEAISISEQSRDVSETSAFAEGDFSVQSLSAMLVGRICDPEPQWNILDTCSAPGGKTAHLAELQGDQGHIDALDANEVRLQMVGKTAERLGLSSIVTFPYDCTYLSEEKERLLPEYDLVLCDVPCSGLGLLHRKPDIRLSMTYEKMQQLLPVQKSILENASLRVRKGGYLVYSTCTVNPNENENQVVSFLREHPDFEMANFFALLPDALKGNERLAEESRKGCMTILPDEEGMDGFFIAKLRRRNEHG
ncbi:MAG: 16S rRNA (cytosine(967)-C(5))-methyltransferase RsmB [Clostridiales bacterium]|nr:16S rRNA (cytosine(967)-C(5))-methyltransferase RsmB [Clostridiales bacterium]